MDHFDGLVLDRGYRIEGFFELDLNARTARVCEDAGPLASVVAGTRFDGLPTYVPPLELEVGFERFAA